MRLNRQEETARRRWRRLMVLPLCVCLLTACSARKQVLPVSVSETERLRDLLSRKRIDASFADGTHVDGRVWEVQDGLLVVDVPQSSGPLAGFTRRQSIPTDRLSTIRFTRQKGYKSLLLGTLFFFGGMGLAAGIIESGEGPSDGRSAAAIGVWSGMTALGYLWGRNKDKENVTVEIQQPDASEGP